MRSGATTPFRGGGAASFMPSSPATCWVAVSKLPDLALYNACMRYCILDSTSPLPSVEELTELYNSVGWSAYTKTPERLIPMLEGSRYLYTAREVTPQGTGRLIGLVRAVGDGQSIAYIQDLLVHPHAQRQGVGSALLKRVIDDFDRADIRQRLITTDVGTEHAVALYKHYGYAPVEAAGCITLACYR